ncbi:MAG: DUF4912 domain-containing protein [Clostridia bacterium]|nr:DUF4912 domain-containing protein [Clostridia bacterium]
MPRKAKDKVEENEKIDEKKTTTKKSTAKKSASTKKTTVKKAEPAVKKAATKKETNTTSKKSTTSKKATTSKTAAKTTKTTKTTTKKAATKKTTAQKSTAKKEEPTKKTTTRRKTTKKATVVEEPPVQIVEYYDLPYKYGNTVVRLLAQTPKTLFVYWEVSEQDIENFKKLYGEDFFSKTKPVLIVHNLTLNKINEIEINDFANCWYLNTEDSDCKFDIELARKFIDNTANDVDNPDNYLYIAKSNNLQSPNNHILFEKIQEFVVFRNASNDNIIKKNIKSFKFLKDIYKFYKDMYDEDVLNNPSSQFKF